MKNTQKLTVVLLLGALSISSTFPADHQRDNQTAHSLTTNPLKSLICLFRINQQFRSEAYIHFMNEDKQELTSLIQSQEKESPIFLVSECPDPNCILSRFRFPKYREHYEKKLLLN